MSTHTERILNVCVLLAATAFLFLANVAEAGPVVPGTGRVIPRVGDNFEDMSWKFIHNLPKSTEEINKKVAQPTGHSVNGRWYEGMKRGQPDILKVVPTPPGGIEGSTGALLMQSIHTGIFGRPSNFFGQDDFVANVNNRLGGSMPVTQSPSVVVRVFLPPIDKWENRSGTSFAFRTALERADWNRSDRRKGGLFSRGKAYRKRTYWPGIFIDFEPKEDTGRSYDSAHLSLRSDQYGHDFKVLEIETTGWWTLGMSVTPDGKVHYYASQGVEALDEDDYIATRNPYGFRAERFKTFFFDICNGDDGRTRSTPWIIDDPAVYWIPTEARRPSPSQN